MIEEVASNLKTIQMDVSMMKSTLGTINKKLQQIQFAQGVLLFASFFSLTLPLLFGVLWLKLGRKGIVISVWVGGVFVVLWLLYLFAVLA